MQTATATELTSTISVNWSNLLDQIRREYDTPPAKGLAHGVQKDGIQNGWGARDTKNRKRWRYEFALINWPGNKLALTMTDAGTVGLRGDVFDSSALPDFIPPDQNLARFENMFDSGGNAGAGLYGRGKLLFNAASTDKLIYYDSLTNDGIYRLGLRQVKGRRAEQYRKVLENDEAKRQLTAVSGGALTPLSQAGTRVTIVNPAEDLVEAVRSGTFLRGIEETWWEIIQKHSAEIIVRQLDGTATQAKLPHEFGGLPERNENGWRVYVRENLTVEVSGVQYRVKRLHFLVTPPGHHMPEDLRGVSVHRRGMKVGPLRLTAVPEELEERLFGYVQLEPGYEDLLAELEDVTHYGFASHYKAAYKNLKQLVTSHFDSFLEQLGYKKAGTDPHEQARQLMEDAQSDLNSILHDLGVPGFGTGTRPEDELLVSVENLKFPDGSNYLSTGDRIAGFSFRIQNTTDEARSVWVEVETYERDVGTIETLQARTRVDIPAGQTWDTDPFVIEILSKYPKYKKIGCVCRLTDHQKQLINKRSFFFFVDLQPQRQNDDHARITLRSAEWPRTQSRRVDYGQSIKNLVYEVENLSPIPMHVRIKLRTLWASEGNAPIAEVFSSDVQLTPFQSVPVTVPELAATREVYQEVDRGKINLRCHATALGRTEHWERGDRLAEHTVSFWLNTDPDYGFFEDTEYFDGGPDQLRSEARPIEGSRSWKLRVNMTHPAYVSAEPHPERMKNYFFEESAKQTVYVLVRMNQVDVLRTQAGLDKTATLDDIEPEDVLERIAFAITDKVLATYYRG